MSDHIKCPWCGEMVLPKDKIRKRKIAEVIERNCPRCGNIIAAYLSGERLSDVIRERVLSFGD